VVDAELEVEACCLGSQVQVGGQKSSRGGLQIILMMIQGGRRRLRG